MPDCKKVDVFITGPAQNTTVGRYLVLTGSVTPFRVTPFPNGHVNKVFVQFDDDQAIDATNPHGGFSWGWVGLIPNVVRPGRPFRITVTVKGTMQTGVDPASDPITVCVEGEAVGNYVLENVVPVLTVAPFRSPIVVSQLPYSFTLEGSWSEANPAVYMPRVQYQFGSGPLTDLPTSQGPWSVGPFSLEPGDYPITVQASDRFDSVNTFRGTLTVLRFEMPAVVDPDAKKTFSGVPTTSSITSWTRLEPQCAGADLGASSNARLFDPLWLMTRQWQLGEFQGEDTGSPVRARVRATSAPLTRCRMGDPTANGATAPYDPTCAPLETLVERRPMRPADAGDARMLTLAVDAGLHFLRMLELDATGAKYRPAFQTTYAMRPLPAQPPPRVDDAALRFAQVMAGRAPDARLLASALRHPTTPQIVFDPSLGIASADVPALQRIAAAWLDWYDALFAEPAGPPDDAWSPPRLEYGASVAARLSAQPQDAVTLSAREFDGGRLDWSSFDADGEGELDTTGDHAFAALNETTIPTPVTFRGAPAARFWELEDAAVAYGLLTAGPTDLAHLLMVEYAGSYGNDWYVVPLTIPVGNVTRVDSLVVTDTFGVRSLLRPIGDPALPSPFFSMWQQAGLPTADDPGGSPVRNLFFLPPTIGRSVDGAALEDVLFMRDEMANLAWGIERSIEGGIEQPVNPASGSAAASASPAPAGPAVPGAPPSYRLSSAVPEYWIPLLRVQLDTQGTLRLRRGAVLQPDGTGKVHEAQSAALKALGGALLFDEEIPREGVHVTLRRRLTRWIDGSTWVWTAFRNDVGRGEGSAGLRFDQIEDGAQP